MLYAILCQDRPDQLAVRAKVRPSHLDYLNAPGSPVRAAGALRNEADEPIGSLIVVDVADALAAKAFADDDPFTKAGIFAEVRVARWSLAIGALVEPG